MNQWKDILGGAIARSADAAIEPAELIRQSPDDVAITAMLNALKAPDAPAAFVVKLYPDGVPTDEKFFSRLARLRTSLGFGQPESEIIAILASAAVAALAEDDRQLILLGIVDVSTPDSGLRIDILPRIVEDHPFPVSLIAKVLVSIDPNKFQGHNGFDRAVHVLAETRADVSFELVEKLIKVAPTDRSLDLARYLLGLLRTRSTSTELVQKIADFDGVLRQSPHQRDRILYLRSLIPTVWQLGLSNERLAELKAVFNSGETEERIVSFEVLVHLAWCPATQETVFYELVQWLETTVNGSLPDRCKTALVVMIHNASFWGKGLIADNLDRLASLWLEILPVDSNNSSYWNGIDLALHDLIEKNRTAFSKVFIRLAEVEGKKLIDAIKDGGARQNRMLLYSLRQAPRNDLVKSLLMSKSGRARRVGLFLYDELNVPIIDKSNLHGEPESHLLLLLLEMRLNYLSGLAAARLLITLLNQADRCSGDFKQELLEDLILHGKDLPGTVLPFLKSIPEPPPLLKEALAKIEEYFNNLRASDDCPALGMSIPGYSKAIELFAKRFSRQVSEATERNSIFAAFVTKIILLYGLNHSYYRNGSLGPAEKLQSISHSQEYPRMGVISPEDHAFRRLVASNWVKKIEKDFHNE